MSITGVGGDGVTEQLVAEGLVELKRWDWELLMSEYYWCGRG